MPLRDDLLNPISEANPGGENLRFAPVYDKIKEARREDDDAPQGEWQRARKTADWPLVIKLASEALATKSKDLQIAAWLTEALLRKEGIPGFREGLSLIAALLDTFWDSLYPELEDGDPELRAVPLEWLEGRMEAVLRSAPLVKKGYNSFHYKEARTVGYESDATSDDKLAARAAAIEDGKVTAEEWDAAVDATPAAWLANLESEAGATLELIERLRSILDERLGDSAPSFTAIRATLEEIQNTLRIILKKKGVAEPEPAPEVEAEPEEEDSGGWSSSEEPAEVVQERKPKPKRGGSLAPEPVDREDACQRVAVAAAFLRREDAYNPAPFLLLRGLRWGEVRAPGYLDANLLEAPSSELRQTLKRLSNESDWQQLLETAEEAMALPCGRGWLDLQRHAYRACNELGYAAPAAAIRSALKSLLADLPELQSATLLDDTPAANAETQLWLQEVLPPEPASHEAPAYEYAPVEALASSTAEAQEDHREDPGETALRAAREGRPQEAIEILTREAAMERSGRGRFQRRLQLAQVCLSIGHHRIAHPILEQLAAEIDSRSLEGWESAEVVVQVLVLLYRCLEKLKLDEARKQQLYDRICRLDPIQALSCTS